MGTPLCEEDPAIELIAGVATLLFANGQTTERTCHAVQRLGQALGAPAALFPNWGELALRVDEGRAARAILLSVAPLGVHMGIVAATSTLVDEVCAGSLDVDGAAAALAVIRRQPPASTARFSLMAAAGAAALGVIFGVMHPISLGLITISAGLGGLLRRGLARTSRNPFLQPIAAALLAGLIGAMAVRLQLTSSQILVAICPCMVLVPGPHFLNGAIDLARARIALGTARAIYAMLTVVAICVGLIGGLTLGGTDLPAHGAALATPLIGDVIAAGVAVAAFGTFFSMPWRTLLAPVAIGMLAHGVHWALLSFAGASAELGAFGACLFAGTLATLAANRLRLPFAGLAFASVVSLIPGVFLFRMASGLFQVTLLGPDAPPALLRLVIVDGTTAVLILLAMTFGLMAPKMLIEHLAMARAPQRSGPEK